MADFKWKPISPLSAQDRKIDLSALWPLYDKWRDARAHLVASHPARLDRIMRPLFRRMITEIGILENLYELDPAATEKLVIDGFKPEHISASSTTIDPQRLLFVLQDQEAALDLVQSAVENKQPLTAGLLHQIQSTHMRRQDTATETDASGKRYTIPMVRGAFKKVRNDSRKPDGSVHEFCPPEEVEKEVGNLLRWLSEYDAEDPLLVTTWFYYNLYQMHPYHHGNGRVVRAAVTHATLRRGLLPVVITRHDRVEYKAAIAAADGDDLRPLAALLARLQKVALDQSLDQFHAAA